MTLEIIEQKTIYDAVDLIKMVARQPKSRDWCSRMSKQFGITNAAGVRAAIQSVPHYRRVTAETLRAPKETAFAGGDIDDCAVFAICLAEVLELPYEIRIKGEILYLYVDGIEVLHKS